MTQYAAHIDREPVADCSLALLTQQPSEGSLTVACASCSAWTPHAPHAPPHEVHTMPLASCRAKRARSAAGPRQLHLAAGCAAPSWLRLSRQRPAGRAQLPFGRWRACRGLKGRQLRAGQASCVVSVPPNGNLKGCYPGTDLVPELTPGGGCARQGLVNQAWQLAVAGAAAAVVALAMRGVKRRPLLPEQADPYGVVNVADELKAL